MGHSLNYCRVEQILNILFAPVRWVWDAMCSQTGCPWDATSPNSFVALAICALLLSVFGYALFAFIAHRFLTSIAWHWGELLRKRAERGNVDELLELAVQAQRSKAWIYSLASRTGVRYGYAENPRGRTPELAGADRLPQRRMLEYLTIALIVARRLTFSIFDLLREAVSSVFVLYVLLGTAWTLRPYWFTASIDSFRRWVQGWDPATVPAAVGLFATVMGLLAAYAFSTKRRARYKSMFDTAVAAENTLTVLGTRAGKAAVEVAKFAHTIALHDRFFCETTIDSLSNGRLQLQDGRVKMINDDRPDIAGRSRQYAKTDWETLCEQREITLDALKTLLDALSQVESLIPFARQAGKHSWSLLRDSYRQSHSANPWPTITSYSEQRYEQDRDDLRVLVNRALKDRTSSTVGNGNATVDVQKLHLEMIEETVERLQSASRRRIWYLAGLYAKLVLCEEEIRRSRSLRGINTFLARIIRH